MTLYNSMFFYNSVTAENSPRSSLSDVSIPPSPTSARTSMDSDSELQKPVEMPWKPTRQEWMAMITMAISSLVTALDATILVPVLPTLAIELNGSATDAFWAGSSYLLASAVLQPFMVALSDVFGRKELIIPSLVIFTVASIVCGIAQNFTVLLLGRVLQGIGGGGIMSLCQVVFADIVPLRQRPKYFASVLASYAVGTMIGPVIGGAFVENMTWRWCFYINFPVCGVALTMAIFCLKRNVDNTSLRAKLARIDWTGGFLFIASLTSFLVALSWGGVQFAWTSWHTLVPLIAGAVGFVFSLFWEHSIASNPFLNKSLFHNFSAIAAYILALLQGFVLFMGLYFGCFYFTAVKLEMPIMAGISVFPATFCFTPAAIIVSALITRLGAYRWAVWMGWTISCLGSGLLLLLDIDTPKAVWATALCIFGIGPGMILSCTNFAIQASVEPQDAGRAAGMYTFMRSLGFAIAVSIGGTIFQNQMVAKLNKLGLPEAIAHNAEAFVDLTLRHLSPTDPLRIGAQQAYVQGFHGVFIAMIGISGAALFLSLFLKHFSLDRILATKPSPAEKV